MGLFPGLLFGAPPAPPAAIVRDGSASLPWITDTAGQAGLDAIEAAHTVIDGQYAVIGASTTPVLYTANVTSGVITWFRPLLGATISSVNAIASDPGGAGWSESIAAGGAIDFDSTEANRIAVVSGSASGQSVAGTPDTRGATDAMCMVIQRAKATDPGGSAVQSATFGVRTSSGGGRGQFLVTTSGNTTWRLYDSGASFDTGIDNSVETTIEVYQDRVNNGVLVVVDRSPDVIAFDAVAVSTAGTELGLIASAYAGSQQSTTCERFAAFYLS
jgi:hypothetical protein